MCGIVGICNVPDNWEETIRCMKQRMVHRGPDADGTWAREDGKVALGHQRLSIVDLSEKGSQPMHSHSGNYTIAFNGEIYNFRSIAKKLLADGKVRFFRGTSDTEVLLEAIEAYGLKEAVTMCKGMFAFALCSRNSSNIYLVRDRMGEKPLYYGVVDSHFAFASDLGSIRAIPGFHDNINKKALAEYFTHGYIPKAATIYENIHQVIPGSILIVDIERNNLIQTAYWSLEQGVNVSEAEKESKISYTDATNRLDELLRGSIREQMLADVPVGAFLSGGIDSSTVVSLMQQESSKPVKTFTIGMEEDGYNEAEAAAKIAKHLGTEHTELIISAKEAQAVIPKLSHMYGEPFADSSQIPTYLVSKMTKEKVTVSLSGDGGDELFCGYGTYDSIPRLWRRLEKIPFGLRSTISKVAMQISSLNQERRTKANLLGAETILHLYEKSLEQESLTSQLVIDYENTKQIYMKSDLSDLNTLMLQDLERYLPNDILTKVDRAAMAVSLETRIPMLDREVVEFAWSLPLSYKKAADGTGKRILRDVLYRYVPKEMMERPKSGFGIPIAKWLREPELRAWAEELLKPSLIEQQGILHAKTVTWMWQEFIDKGVWRIQIWYILMFQQWLMTEGAGL